MSAALAFGGVGLAVSTVESYTGVPIDHVALIDFDGIEGLVDTLGGVDVDVPVDFEADGHQFTEGTQSMDGEQDRKSTRLNSSHVAISYAVFCLKTEDHPHSHGAV